MTCHQYTFIAFSCCHGRRRAGGTPAIRRSSGIRWADAHAEEFEQLLAARLAYPTPAYAWRRQYTACEEFLARGIDAVRVTHPTLVVHGTADRVVPFENAALLVETLPHAELLRLEGAGHLALLERPQETNRAIVEFLLR